MLRNVNLSEISDGKLYDSNDMVKADCLGCKGCSACCRGMGSSIVLDPLDVHRLVNGLGTSFEALLSVYLELNVADGLILPNLKMTEDQDACPFLNEMDRCSIHAIRPGFCRLFPLGRFYENGSFRYFLQIHECPKPGKAKIKIHKWIETDDIRKYEKFINDWHYFLKELQEYALSSEDTEKIKAISMYILQQFYLAPYAISEEAEPSQEELQDLGEETPCQEDFYQIFSTRLKTAQKAISKLL